MMVLNQTCEDTFRDVCNYAYHKVLYQVNGQEGLSKKEQIKLIAEALMARLHWPIVSVLIEGEGQEEYFKVERSIPDFKPDPEAVRDIHFQLNIRFELSSCPKTFTITITVPAYMQGKLALLYREERSVKPEFSFKSKEYIDVFAELLHSDPACAFGIMENPEHPFWK